MGGDGATPARRCVLVTGGARGIGAAIVRVVAATDDVIFTYRNSQAEAEALAVDVAGATGAHVVALPLDLADPAAVETFAKTLAGQEIGAFVHNAGQSYDTLAVLMNQERAEAAMQVNFWAFAKLAGALARPMLARRAGRIVAIGSVAALQANQGNAAYAASKAALLGYVRTLALESAKRGVTVNYVAPGFVDTEMLAAYADHRAKMESQIPIGRFARPEEVAALVAFLLTGPAGAITGAVLPVDGGLTASMGLQR